MSTPAQPPADGTTHPTRQQLDELDALIKRMLTLPVDEAGEEPASAPAARAAGPAPERLDREAPQVPPARPESPAAPDFREAGRETAHTSAQPTDAAPPAAEQARAGMAWSEAIRRPGRPDDEDASERPAPQSTTSISDMFSALRREVSATPAPEPPRRSSAAVLLGPLVWMNAAFDRGTTWLGPGGAWLRGPGVRAVLGWTGLALLAAAVAWAIVGWIGWTW